MTQLKVRGFVVTPAQLMGYGCREVAYVRQISVRKARELLPNVQDIWDMPLGRILFLACHADGEPLALVDTRQAAIGAVIEMELYMVDVH